MKFEWDEKKRKTNIQKHGIDFDEAKTVFYDEEALLIPDPDHSDDEVIRIINARKANAKEKKQYTTRKKK